MCKVGDIILIDKCKCNGKDLGKHSFIVVSDKISIAQIQMTGSQIQ